MPFSKPLLILITSIYLTCTPLLAKPLDYYFPANQNFDQNITAPDEFIGHQVGEFHARHDLIISYLRYIAATSERAHLIEMGMSWEKRPQVLLVISDPENIKALQAKLNEGSAFKGDNAKLTVWLGYSIHGNEPSGANASLLSSYYFSALESSEHDAVLKDTYILIEPTLNPDGYGRFSNWVNNNRSLNLVSDPMDREHQEAWPRGRTNHYRFDLNRDWLLATQNESKNRLKWFHYFHPNVFGDFHEMGTNSTYFFQPGVPTRKFPMTPQENVNITADIATYHAKMLDDIGSLYYNKQDYDDYYIGKGSTYPDIQGSVGILFEQGSSRGHLQDSINGPLAFPHTVRNQFVTSLSTVAGAYANKTRLLNYRENFYNNARDDANSDRSRGLVISSQGDQGRLMAMVDKLLRHQIQVYRLGESFKVDGNTIRDGIVIPYQQRQYRLIKAMFETRTQFEDNTFYDVSTWNFAHAFNLPYEVVERRRWKDGLMGAEITAAALPEGTVAAKSSIAYVIDWAQLNAPAAVEDLTQQGLFVRMARDPFEFKTSAGNQKFAAGTVVVPVGLQTQDADAIYNMMREIAARHHLTIESVSTGLAVSGIDLGSRDMIPINKIKPVLLAGDGTSSYETGHLWFFMDNYLGIAMSQVDLNRFSRLNLDNYTHLLMVSGNYSSLSEQDVERIKTWVRGGGVIIGMKSANNWLSEQKILSADVSRTSSELNDKTMRVYRDMSEDNAQRHIGGSIFKVEVDTSHPLSYGLNSNTVSAFKNHRHIIGVSKNPYHNVMSYSDKPLVSGYISAGNLDNIANSVFLSAERLGRGSVIAIADNPVFRGYWLGTSRVLTNSLFFGTAFSRPNQ